MKVAIVTGSTQGLGAGIAARLARDGMRVVLTGRNEKKGKALAAKLKGLYVQADLGRVEDCRAIVAATLKKFGGVDVLVNSAASSERSTLETFTPEKFDELFHLNVRAPLILAQAAIGSLQKRRGVIINIGSINAYVGFPNLLIYAATKGALMNASRTLAHGYRSARVRVHLLNCGWMDTDGERAVQAKAGHPPDFLDTVGKKLPIGRLILPSDVTEVVSMLASDRAQAFSGCVIDLEQFPIGTLHDFTL